ncbi:MAG: HD domain-containing phosphohydrolase [Lachnospiraceae bacterium]
MVLSKSGTDRLQQSESEKQLDRMSTNIIRALVHTIDAKDRYTSGHSQRVADYALAIAKRMGKSEEEQKIVYIAGLLHDVGKIRIPEEVISKPEKPTEEEYGQIKVHPIIGYLILRGIHEDERIAYAAKYHHERYDGTGYPNGLEGENIPEIARIIGVADAYDAMASNRSYRSALPQEVIRSEIEKGKGNQFDEKIADIMLQIIDEDKDYSLRQSEMNKKNVLVVDDEHMNIRMVEYILKDEPDLDVIGAKTKEETFRALEEQEIHLILLDLRMPDVDGFELYQMIREKYSVPVVLVTSDRGIETIQKISELGIDDYLTKPLDAFALKEMVHGIMNSWGSM